MNKIDNNKKALHFFDLSFEYLSLVENTLNETISSGNNHLIISDYNLADGKYEEMTNWSDFNIIIPVLYNFYHGLELLMKGVLFINNLDDKVKAKHNIEGLFEIIKSNDKITESIKNILASHVDKKNMYDLKVVNFLKENNISINEMYQAFRYPLDNKFEKTHDYYDLHSREDAAIPYYKKIVNDSIKLRMECVKQYRERVSN